MKLLSIIKHIRRVRHIMMPVYKNSFNFATYFSQNPSN
ncbi:leader peptide SpeFL [Moritella sp.]